MTTQSCLLNFSSLRLFPISCIAFLSFPSFSFLSVLTLHHPVNNFFLLFLFLFCRFCFVWFIFFFVYLAYVMRLCGFLLTQDLTLQVFSPRKYSLLRPTERLADFEPRTFRFWLPRLNPLGHSPQMQNALFWGPVFPNIWAKAAFVQKYAMSVLRWKNVTLWKKKLEKALLLRKMLNWSKGGVRDSQTTVTS